jgi:hypothetical protein
VPAYCPSSSTYHSNHTIHTSIHTSHSPSVRFQSPQQQLHRSAKFPSPYGHHFSFSPIPQTHLKTPTLNIRIFRAAPLHPSMRLVIRGAQSYLCMDPGRTAALALSLPRLSSHVCLARKFSDKVERVFCALCDVLFDLSCTLCEFMQSTYIIVCESMVYCRQIWMGLRAEVLCL